MILNQWNKLTKRCIVARFKTQYNQFLSSKFEALDQFYKKARLSICPSLLSIFIENKKNS